ncbi:MAG: hypothetical protein ABFD86_14080, partial [Bryobacteraceae bacterium]
AIRRRYDGERRNPWDEAECGHHYARAMASWSAIVALSGFQYSGVTKSLALKPLVNQEAFRSFWSAPSGWGSFEQKKTGEGYGVAVTVAEGALSCRSVALGLKVTTCIAKLGGREVPCTAKDSHVTFARDIQIRPGTLLELAVAGS